MQEFPDGPSTFVCVQCGNLTTKGKGCRMRSKGSETWACAQCNTKCSLLHRTFGCWPTQEFKTMPKDAQMQFWKDIQGKGGQDLRSFAEDKMKTWERKTETYAFNGEFRPLDFWEKQGYDKERILRNARTDEIHECRMAGKTYKVPIKVDSKQTERGRERDETISSTSKKQKLSSMDQLQQLFKQPDQPGNNSEPSETPNRRAASSTSDPTSSSSSSSSSSDRKKKKKKKNDKKKKRGKKDKKDKKKSKEREMRDKEKAKEDKLRQAILVKEEKKHTVEQKKRISAAKKNADLLIKKSEKAFIAMNLTVQCQHFQVLPMSVTGNFKANFDEIKSLREGAQALQGLTRHYKAYIRAL
jgi:hypothetical protein